MPGIDWHGDVDVWHLLMPKDTLLCGVEISQGNGGCSDFGAVTCPKCKELRAILDNPRQALHRAEAAEAEAKRLREALERAGNSIAEMDHAFGCDVDDEDGECDCILGDVIDEIADALASPAPEQPPQPRTADQCGTPEIERIAEHLRVEAEHSPHGDK